MAHPPRRSLLLASLVAALASIVACASAPPDDPPSATLSTGTFTTALPSTSGGGNTYPFHEGEDVKWETLYVTSEVGGAGYITGLRFHRGTGSPAGTVTCPKLAVRLGHTTIDPVSAPTISITFSANVDASTLSTVFSGSLVISAANDSWFDVPFAEPYAYNGIDNLLVEVESLTACSGTVPLKYASVAWGRRRALSFAVDSLPNDPDHNVTTAGGSSPDTVLAAVQFLFAGGELRKTFGGNASYCFPFTSQPPNGLKMQTLILATDLNASGPITGLAYQMNEPSLATTQTVTFRIGYTTATELSTSFASNVQGALVTVADRFQFSMPAGMPAGSWVWVPFLTPFDYDGVRNLVIQTETEPQTAYSCGVNLRWASRTNSNLEAVDLAATTGTLLNRLHHMAFRFAGGPIFLAPRPYLHSTFGLSTASQIQSLIVPARLGAVGQITRLGLRIGGTTAAATVSGFQVYLGQTSRRAFVLADSFAANMDGGGTLVFSGNLVVPGGLRTGDWLDIPLQTAFTIDPTKSLIVYLRSPGSGTANTVSYSIDLAQFPAQCVDRTGFGNVTDVPTVLDSGYVGAFRLFVVR